MLFIWDLHIKTDKKSEIFSKLKEIIDNSDKENIIFLWDYIYHFNYNPKVIEEFFDILLEYSKNWKKIYILAWNHDYIKGHFIFAEAEKIAKLWNFNIHIISQAEIKTINNKKILFFPFYTRIANEEEFIQTDKVIKKLTNHKYKDLIVKMFFTAYQNWKQDEKWLKISWTINLDLINFLIKNEDIDMIIHHFYTVNTSFPGQFAKFSYKNISLDDKIFELNLEIFSWHLHKSFKHKNYTCIWSFWNTTPLEENDTKIVLSYPDKFQQVIINPYISFELKDEKEIDKNDIIKKWGEIEKEAENLLWSSLIKDKFDIKKINLIIKSQKFLDINEIINKNTLDKINSITYRQISKQKLWNILNNLEIDHEKLWYSFDSWKQLANNYISQKYPEKKEEYFKILEKLDLE